MLGLIFGILFVICFYMVIFNAITGDWHFDIQETFIKIGCWLLGGIISLALYLIALK